MPAPESLKIELLRLLDEAYDADGVAISRITLTDAPFLYYGNDAPLETLPEEFPYKIAVDASDKETIRIRIRPLSDPWVWPY